MTIQASYPVEDRILHLFQYLGIEQAHFAACMPRDWGGLVTSHPDIVSSLTLVCPMGMNLSALRVFAPHSNIPRLLVITGDHGRSPEEVLRAMPSLPDDTLITLRDYFSPTWADMIADRTEEIGSEMIAFLSGIDQRQQGKEVTLPEGEGEVADISYRIRGSGPPLVLLPLGLAPSQWQPLLPALSANYCTITLGGLALGMVAFLEARSQGYLRVVRCLVDEVQPRPIGTGRPCSK